MKSKKTEVKRYKNLSGQSGISGYDLLPDAIKIRFNDNSLYLYNYEIPGKREVEIMKGLAQKGIGLTTFINQEVRGNFAAQLA